MLKALGEHQELSYLHSKKEFVDVYEESSVKCNEKLIADLRFCFSKSSKEGNDKNVVLFVSVTVKRILILIRENNLDFPHDLFDECMSYITRFWDYSADVVCHECVDSFQILMDLHKRGCSSPSTCGWTIKLSETLLDPTFLNKSSTRCLAIFLNENRNFISFLGENMVRRFYNLFNNMSLANAISELIILHLSFRESWSVHIKAIEDFVSHPTSRLNLLNSRLFKRIVKDGTLTDFLVSLLESLNATEGNPRVLETILSIAQCLIEAQKTSRNENIATYSKFVKKETILSAILHSSCDVATSAFRLIVFHPRRSLPFEDDDLELIKLFLVINMNIQDSALRQKILAGVRYILERVATNAESLLKSDEEVTKYIDFVRFISTKAFESLAPEGNFYRRVMAIHTILIAHDRCSYVFSGKQKFASLLDPLLKIIPTQADLLIDCLQDSHVLCQTAALEALNKLEIGVLKDTFLSETYEMMSSLLTWNETGAAYRMKSYLSKNPERRQEVLDKLVTDVERSVKIVATNLVQITKNPVHPSLNVLAQLMADGESQKEWTNDKLVPLCFKVAEITSPIVYSASPEGYIPEDALQNLENGTTEAELSQLLLVCCWRAMKQASDIFSLLVEKTPELLSEEHISSIGTFYWNILTECKHRGAFECAIEGFTKLCTLLWRTNHPDPSRWLYEILHAIEGKRDLSNLCSTRRSAGLPYLVSTIVSTEPEALGNRSLRKATRSLLNMERKSREYRVHSLNVMKVLVSTSSLSERITFALEQALFQAINACSSEWSERNAAMQLFAALRTRIFGVSRSVQRTLMVDPKNRQSNFEFFSKFPSLYKMLYEQVTRKEQSELSLVPPLVILTHLHSKATTNGAVYPLAPFVPPLLKLATSQRRENLRSHAVAAILSIADEMVLNDILKWIEETNLTCCHQNHIHAVLELLKGILSSEHDDTRVVGILKKASNEGMWMTWHDWNVNIFLELCNQKRIEVNVEGVDVGRFVLAKRQLAVSNASVGVHDSEYRIQVYRNIVRTGTWPENFPIKVALDDVNFENPPDIVLLLKALCSGVAKMTKTDKTNVLDRIQKHLNGTPGVVAACYKLMVFLGYETCDGLVQWIEDSFEEEQLEAKNDAIEVATSLVRSSTSDDPSLIRAISLYLSDDEPDIREKASSSLQNVLGTKFSHLNPNVTLALLTRKYPEKNPTDLQEETQESRDVLFGACSLNSYAEKKQFLDPEWLERVVFG